MNQNTSLSESGYIQPRLKESSFIPVDPAAHNYFVEENPAQYIGMIPDNLGMFDVMGSNAKTRSSANLIHGVN